MPDSPTTASPPVVAPRTSRSPRPSGSVAGEVRPEATTPAPTRCKRLADEAVQVARLSPVHREYVPTLGPVRYAEARGFTEATANVDLAARAAALEAVLASCRAAKVTGAGFHIARGIRDGGSDGERQSQIFPVQRGQFQRHGANRETAPVPDTSPAIISISPGSTSVGSPSRRWTRRFVRRGRKRSSRASIRSSSSLRRWRISSAS